MEMKYGSLLLLSFIITDKADKRNAEEKRQQARKQQLVFIAQFPVIQK